MKIRPVDAEFYADERRQADVIKLTVALWNFADAPKKTKYFVLYILVLCNNMLLRWKNKRF